MGGFLLGWPPGVALISGCQATIALRYHLVVFLAQGDSTYDMAAFSRLTSTLHGKTLDGRFYWLCDILASLG